MILASDGQRLSSIVDRFDYRAFREMNTRLGKHEGSSLRISRMSQSNFDQYANNYEAALQQGLRASGESAAYFASGRTGWTADCLKRLGCCSPMESILDFGCGTGNSIEYLLEHFDPRHIVGLDTSVQSLEQARKRFDASRSTFVTPSEYASAESIDLIYCNGVFHHIPPIARPEVLSFLYRTLKPKGYFAFWENNPWNPGTRYVMSKIPFDNDAIPLSIPEAKRLLSENGFRVVRTDTLFYFPRMLSWLRWSEPFFSKLPLGAQYLVLTQKT
jgi:SAM-dependent methyltransferase